MYLLDTSICVFFLRGKLDFDRIFAEKGKENLYISEATIFELRYGAENSSEPRKAHAILNDFIVSVNIIPLYGMVNRYATEKVRLRRNGTPMHDEFDLLIGVTAVENQLILVTDNTKHFMQIEDIRLENWWKEV